MPYKDSEQQKAAQRRHYLRNKAAYIESATTSRAERRRALAAYVKSIKTGEICVDCDQPYPHYVLEFDHVRGDPKVDCIAHLVNAAVPLGRLQDEIAKCQLVCANCHRERTWARLSA